MHAEDYGYPRLAGLGSREETIRLWSELTGLRADNLEWYEIVAALRARDRQVPRSQGTRTAGTVGARPGQPAELAVPDGPHRLDDPAYEA